MNKQIVVSLLIGTLIGSTGCYTYFLLRGKPKSYLNQTFGREKAYNYLINSYNSTLGLCYEYLGSNTYWVSNDNVLASYALQQWNRTIADNITQTVKKIANKYGLLTSQTGIPLNCRAEILLGYNVNYFFNATVPVTLNSSYYGSFLKTEIATNEILTGFENYSDLLCYASLVEWRRGNYSGADYYYEKVKAMWDGKGFNDNASKEAGYYATYKLGLFYLLSRTLNKDINFKKELIERVWLCQSVNGGFWTDYYGNGTIPLGCKTNTETTSMILLADVPSLFEYDC